MVASESQVKSIERKFIVKHLKSESLCHKMSCRCRDTQHNDNQHNDTQHNDTQCNDTQRNDGMP